MGDILVRQKLEMIVAKAPAAGAALTEKDFDYSAQFELTSLSEDAGGRFSIPDGASDVALSMGTVAAGKTLVIVPETAGLQLKIQTGSGTPVPYTLAARASVLHMDFTGLLVSNSTGSPIKGRYIVVGD